MARTYTRDAIGRFARKGRGRSSKLRKALRGLGRRLGRGGRKTNVKAAGGTIGGVGATAAAARIRTIKDENVVNGKQLRRKLRK